MKRPRVLRQFTVLAANVALVMALVAGTTGASLAADTRMAYFGDPANESTGNGVIVATPVTAGGVFTFDLLVRNTGTQTLTHGVVGLGTGAAARATTIPSLPAGAQILSATLNGNACSFDTLGATCQVGNLAAGATATASFIVQAPPTPGPTDLWASFRVAENVNDRGANTNTFFADATLPLPPTNSDGISTYLLPGQALALGTAGQDPVGNDPQRTTLQVPGAFGGLVSIVETDGPTGCTPKCIGQTVQANVRNGAPLSPYLEWTLVINRTDVTPSKGGVIHTLDNGTVVTIANTKANQCSTVKLTNCIVSFDVNKKLGTTTIVFRTPSNGAIRGFG